MPTAEAESPIVSMKAITPMALLQTALEKGLDADQLQKFTDLCERWEKTRASEAYNSAMNLAQREMPTVVRDAENTETRKKYAPLETVQKAIKPVYSKHGFALSFGTDESPKDGHFRVICDVKHSGGHSERYCLFDLPIDDVGPKGAKNKTGIQGSVSTLSYGQRKLTCMIFNVTIANEDADGNGEVVYITEHQVETIEMLIKESDTNRKGFLEWIDAETVQNIPSKNFSKAIDGLQANLRKAKQKAGAK